MGEAEDWLSGLVAVKLHRASIKETELYMNQMRNADVKIEEITLPAASQIAAAINSGAMEAEAILQFVASLLKGSAELTVPAAAETSKKASKNKKSREQAKRKKVLKAKAKAGKKHVYRAWVPDVTNESQKIPLPWVTTKARRLPLMRRLRICVPL